ncbi:MAG TPA: DUF1015 domain-containing protein [Phycisphaerae bacterium]|nr:DUF1015 domain-containing protein [Phycisphaerae bacterium]
MAAIAPLQAIRYPQQNQTSVVSPPYDVLSGEEKSKMLAKDGHNIVAVDLPHIPPKEAGPDAAYEAAAHTMRMWLEAGILKQDEKPAIYAYQQTYTYAGNTYKRRGFFCRVRLEDFGETSTIHPHEQTFSGPKEDRLKLMRATQANLSPVFGLYDDPKNDVTDLLFEAISSGGLQKPLASAELPSQDHKSVVLSELWAVTDTAVIKDVQLLMADKHLYIADGHHRYTTSLNYRKEVSAAKGTPLEHNDPANFALFVCIAMQDAGLIILPTHRVLPAAALQDFYLEKFCEVAETYCEVIETKFRGDSLGALEQELSNGSYGEHAMGVYDPVEDAAVVIRPKVADPLGAFKDDPAMKGKSDAWRQLDVAILQHLVFDRLIVPHFVGKGAGGGKVSYAFPHEAHEVAALCRAGGGTQYRVGFLLQPTPLESVRDLCNANELMPQKSTFFYPKLATGMVINSLT